MLKQQAQLKQNAEQNVKAIESLLNDYSLYISSDQASFLASYLKSLQLDMESAMTRGDKQELEIIVEDIESIKENALERLAGLRQD